MTLALTSGTKQRNPSPRRSLLDEFQPMWVNGWAEPSILNVNQQNIIGCQLAYMPLDGIELQDVMLQPMWSLKQIVQHGAYSTKPCVVVRCEELGKFGSVCLPVASQ